MVQEVVDSHKIIPQWSSYEAGMEALANSIVSLNQRGNDNRKGLTAGDLLIKPIQRICKYPMLFLDLHKHTPVVDCPSSHAEVDGALSNFREMVREINLATDDPRVRQRIQRRWLLQDRLKLGPDTLEATQFRMLGHILLCGVLHVAYQTNNRVEGGYMLCMMFKDYLVVAAPAAGQTKFDILLTVYLSDAKVVSTEDGRGMLSVPSW
jgi:RhoGEF domain